MPQMCNFDAEAPGIKRLSVGYIAFGGDGRRLSTPQLRERPNAPTTMDSN